MPDTCFVDRLTLASVMRFARAGWRGAVVHWFEPPTRAGALLARLLTAITRGRLRFAKVTRFTSEMLGEDGSAKISTIYNNGFDSAAVFIERAIDRHPVFATVGGRWSAGPVRLHLRKAAEAALSRECARLQLAAWILRQEVDGSTRAAIWLADAPWLPELTAYGEAIGLQVRRYPHRQPLAALLEAARCLGRALRSCLLAARKPRLARPEVPSIALRYWHRSLSLDPGERSEFFWLPADCHAPIILCEYTGGPPEAAHQAELARRGITIYGPRVNRWIPTGAYPGELFRCLAPLLLRHGWRLLLPGTGRFLVVHCARLMGETAYWSDFFRHHRTSVLAGTFFAPIGQVMAIDRLGGLALSYQYSISNIAAPTTMLTSGEHLHAVFSRHFARLWQRSGATAPWFVEVGSVYDQTAWELPASLTAVQQRLREHGAKTILCYFDENSIDRWFTAMHNALAVEEYRHLLSWVIARPDVGLIMKPKAPKTLPQRLTPIAGLLAQALASGRCALLATGEGNEHVYPAHAALAADLVVGDLCGASAAFESWRAGRRAVLVDTRVSTHHPLYRFPCESLIFGSWDALLGAVDRWRAQPTAWPEFADWSGVEGFLDPYCDGLGAARLGWLITALHRALTPGANRETAAAAVLAEYAERYPPRLTAADPEDRPR